MNCPFSLANGRGSVDGREETDKKVCSPSPSLIFSLMVPSIIKGEDSRSVLKSLLNRRMGIQPE